MFQKKIQTIIQIEGMQCSHCAQKVKKGLENMKEVKKVTVDLSKNQAIVISSPSLAVDEVKQIIEALGYQVTAITKN